MRVVVTGGSGKLGRAVIAELTAHGYEVRNADWRAQFVGKNVSAPLKLSQDIKNISGATLSCRHITDGVKRILATYEIALK